MGLRSFSAAAYAPRALCHNEDCYEEGLRNIDLGSPLCYNPIRS